MEYTTSTGIKYEVITEGNLSAVKDTDDFGGPNKWRLHIMSTEGYWESVQWMDVYNIQQFFKTKLTVYKEEEKKKAKYEVAQ
jgi:hypothetical protein